MGGVKNENDLRYRKREKAILGALIKIIRNKDYALTVRPSQVYREAGVSRSTFRRHYREVEEILKKKDKEILKEFKKVIGNEDLKAVWRKMLIFIIKNQEIFELKIRQSDDKLIRKMIEWMDAEMDFGWGRYGSKIRGRIFEMFYAEATGVLSIWVNEGMRIDNVEKIAGELTYLTEIADKKWSKRVVYW